MTNNIFTRRRSTRCFCLGALLLTLLGMLAGCSIPSTTPAYAFTGALTIYHVPEPYSLPGTMRAGSDGSFWFPAVAYPNFATQKPGGAIGRMMSNGTFHMFPLPTPNSYPNDLAIASDGSLWFTVFQGNGKLAPNVDQAPHFTGGYGEIGHMTPGGKFTFLRLPAPNASARSIARGPDGNLWFAESINTSQNYIGKIVRLTPSGLFTEFALPTPGDFVSAITAGPDGNVWFTIQSSKGYNAVCKVGRITPRGKITVFTPKGLYTAGDITSGPDNNLWFTSGYYIVRITPKGQIREFSMPGQGFSRSSAAGITTNSDGALWFSTPNAWMGRMSTNGTIKQYPFPANTNFDSGGSSLTMSERKGIVAGPDGTLWLTDYTQIGHFR